MRLFIKIITDREPVHSPRLPFSTIVVAMFCIGLTLAVSSLSSYFCWRRLKLTMKNKNIKAHLNSSFHGRGYDGQTLGAFSSRCPLYYILASFRWLSFNQFCRSVLLCSLKIILFDILKSIFPSLLSRLSVRTLIGHAFYQKPWRQQLYFSFIHLFFCNTGC